MLDEIHFESWDQFKSHLREYLQPPGEFVFRGQGNVGWRLQTSLARALAGTKINITAETNLRRSIMTNFVREARLFGKNLPKTEIGRWALGQHYGLPSPLLDWTDSPYIASFFAFESAFGSMTTLSAEEIYQSKSRVAIFALRVSPQTILQWKKMRIKFERDSGYDNENARIRNQLGLFMLLPKGAPSLDDCVTTHFKRDRKKIQQLIQKFTIPYSSTTDALEDLALMEFNARRIYNDWPGVSKTAFMRTKLDIQKTFSISRSMESKRSPS